MAIKLSKDDYVSHKGREGKIENVDVPCVVLFWNILTSMRIFVHMLPYQPVHIRCIKIIVHVAVYKYHHYIIITQ